MGPMNKMELHSQRDNQVLDPVCGMSVDPNTTKHTHVHADHSYYFCNPSCLLKFSDTPEAYIKAIDPVCGMTVERATARHMTKLSGERFYFCSAGCQTKFEAEPDAYLGDRPAPEPLPSGTQYTCPMDPEIITDEPGRLSDLRHGP